MRITTDEGMQMFLHIKRKGSSMTKKKRQGLSPSRKTSKTKLLESGGRHDNKSWRYSPLQGYGTTCDDVRGSWISIVS